MKKFNINLITLTECNMVFYSKDSVLLMLYEAIENCENDGEKNAIQCLINAIKGAKPV